MTVSLTLEELLALTVVLGIAVAEDQADCLQTAAALEGRGVRDA